MSNKPLISDVSAPSKTIVRTDVEAIGNPTLTDTVFTFYDTQEESFISVHHGRSDYFVENDNRVAVINKDFTEILIDYSEPTIATNSGIYRKQGSFYDEKRKQAFITARVFESDAIGVTQGASATPVIIRYDIDFKGLTISSTQILNLLDADIGIPENVGGTNITNILGYKTEPSSILYYNGFADQLHEFDVSDGSILESWDLTLEYLPRYYDNNTNVVYGVSGSILGNNLELIKTDLTTGTSSYVGNFEPYIYYSSIVGATASGFRNFEISFQNNLIYTFGTPNIGSSGYPQSFEIYDLDMNLIQKSLIFLGNDFITAGLNAFTLEITKNLEIFARCELFGSVDDGKRYFYELAMEQQGKTLPVVNGDINYDSFLITPGSLPTNADWRRDTWLIDEDRGYVYYHKTVSRRNRVLWRQYDLEGNFLSLWDGDIQGYIGGGSGNTFFTLNEDKTQIVWLAHLDSDPDSATDTRFVLMDINFDDFSNSGSTYSNITNITNLLDSHKIIASFDNGDILYFYAAVNTEINASFRYFNYQTSTFGSFITVGENGNIVPMAYEYDYKRGLAHILFVSLGTTDLKYIRYNHNTETIEHISSAFTLQKFSYDAPSNNDRQGAYLLEVTDNYLEIGYWFNDDLVVSIFDTDMNLISDTKPIEEVFLNNGRNTLLTKTKNDEYWVLYNTNFYKMREIQDKRNKLISNTNFLEPSERLKMTFDVDLTETNRDYKRFYIDNNRDTIYFVGGETTNSFINDAILIKKYDTDLNFIDSWSSDDTFTSTDYGVMFRGVFAYYKEDEGNFYAPILVDDAIAGKTGSVNGNTAIISRFNIDETNLQNTTFTPLVDIYDNDDTSGASDTVSILYVDDDFVYYTGGVGSVGFYKQNLSTGTIEKQFTTEGAFNRTYNPETDILSSLTIIGTSPTFSIRYDEYDVEAEIMTFSSSNTLPLGTANVNDIYFLSDNVFKLGFTVRDLLNEYPKDIIYEVIVDKNLNILREVAPSFLTGLHAVNASGNILYDNNGVLNTLTGDRRYYRRWVRKQS